MNRFERCINAKVKVLKTTMEYRLKICIALLGTGTILGLTVIYILLIEKYNHAGLIPD